MDITRRQFLGASLGSALSLGFAARKRLFADGKTEASAAPKRKTRACILLWMDGGPSHIDSFDPKPGREEGGPFRAIPTPVAGMRLTEHLPRLATRARDLAIVRTVTSPIADHGIANYLMHTGYVPAESVEHPSLGSILSRVWQDEEKEVPSYVFVGEAVGDANSTRFGGGYLGERYAPFTLGVDDSGPVTIRLPKQVDQAEFRRRLEWLGGYEERFGKKLGDLSATQKALQERAARYMDGPLAKALNLGSEARARREEYGLLDGELDPFGQGCLLARRLVESGSKFVEVSMTGWDTHEDNFRLNEQLLRRTDAGFAALLEDLQGRGLLESTMVIWMGEFGRTPEINAQKGRDHHSNGFSVVLAGGGVKGGQVVGRTDERGGEVADRPVKVQDLFATILTLAGVDLDREFYTPERRPIRVVDESGEPMRELV